MQINNRNFRPKKQAVRQPDQRVSNTFPLLAANSFAGLVVILGLIAIFTGVVSTAHADGPFPIDPAADWLSGDTDFTRGIAWGDVDNDGDLDLAVANDGQPNRVYRNHNGRLQTAADNPWASNDSDDTTAVAWGDVDDDGDLDLAVANFGERNKLYLNDNGLLQPDPAWLSDESDASTSLAWGDFDGDGDLDLAVGNTNRPNRVYRNNAGTLLEVAVWSSNDSDRTESVAWGDFDGDDDLDLVVGNRDPFDAGIGQNKLYLNDDGSLQVDAGWLTTESDDTEAVAWGDFDSDGDLDLAVANRSGPNRVYRYHNDILEPDPIWSSTDDNNARGLAWGDGDGDGDLDLAVTGYDRADKIYQNDSGSLTTTPVWSATLSERTHSLAWGDLDGDGDLDLAAGKAGPAGGGGLNKLYLNHSSQLQTGADPIWLSADSQATRSLAWGDVDGDGDLDLAAGNEVAPNHLYLNQAGTLQATPVWTSTDTSRTWSVAWGDVDGDGDLDLAAANTGAGSFGASNHLYRNEGGMLQPTPVWTSTHRYRSFSLAWGDVDDDGDLDLVVGNSRSANQLYLNENGNLPTEPNWESDDKDQTWSVAWGDVDGDIDLDLVVGNSAGSNKLYLNKAGQLETTPIWLSGDSEHSIAVAWGDVDADGDLDLAVGNQLANNGALNKLYLNQAGQLQTAVDAPWSSLDTDVTTALGWADFDNDGDLDLAVGNNSSSPDKLYLNQGGALRPAIPIWTSGSTDNSFGLAWGDVNGDGYPDLALGDTIAPNKLFRNRGAPPMPGINHPPRLLIDRPGQTQAAFFYATPEILQTPFVTLTYRLYDRERDTVLRILPQYSPNGGGQWLPATPGPGGDGLTDLSASPAGTGHTFVWHAGADLIKGDNLVFRLTALPGYRHSPILWPAQKGHSPSFRVAARQFIQVINGQGDSMAGVPVYRNGQAITQTTTGLNVTDSAGLLNPVSLEPGDDLVALVLQAEQPTQRGLHNGWAYRTYLTNISVDSQGQTEGYTVNNVGRHRLVVKPENPLIVFNLLVSVEWDATEEYLQDIALAMERAADFLYDVSDGQMTFGPVTIFDNAAHWTEADIQIATKNVVHPHAFVGGLVDPDKSHLIRVGRSWDGNTANQGNWSERDGFATLVHEFGHYGLGLYDEYFGYKTTQIGDEVILLEQIYTFCSGPDNRQTPDLEAGASIMDFHYATGELADSGRWSDWCTQTAQHLLNQGESDWETIKRLYGDPQNRWQLRSPDERAGLGQVVPGPVVVPSAMPFPQITVHNHQVAVEPKPFPVQVCVDGLPYRQGAWITLNRAGGTAMDQGVTDEANGQLTILGAQASDSLAVVSLDGALAGSKLAGQARADGYLDLTASVAARRLPESIPYLRLWPTTSNNTLDGLRLSVSQTSPTDSFRYSLTGPDTFGPSAAIPYQADSAGHQIEIGFVPPARAGYANVSGNHAGDFIDFNVDYRLQEATNASPADLFSSDGNFKLHLDAGALPLAQAHFLIASPWGLPGSLPPGLEMAGEAYEITASGNLTEFQEPAVLRLRYDAAAANTLDTASLAIYRWRFVDQQWQPFEGTHSPEAQEVATTTTSLGLYALLGRRANHIHTRPPESTGGLCGSGQVIYLPLVGSGAGK